MIENQEEITFAEFKAWLAGLIRGKGGALPDLEDWKAIKETMDKVVPDTVDGPTWPVFPFNPVPPHPDLVPQPYTPQPYITPQPYVWPNDHTGNPPWQPFPVWCDDNIGAWWGSAPDGSGTVTTSTPPSTSGGCVAGDMISGDAGVMGGNDFGAGVMGGNTGGMSGNTGGMCGSTIGMSAGTGDLTFSGHVKLAEDAGLAEALSEMFAAQETK